MKIRPMGAELFHTGWRADGRKDGHNKTNMSLLAILQTRLNHPNSQLSNYKSANKL